MKKIKIAIPNQKVDSGNKIQKTEIKDDNKKMENREDSKPINKSFKNVHQKPADEQEFENNI